MITDTDIQFQVEQSLTHWVHEYDVRGITEEIMNTFGRIDIDTIPSETYWGIVSRHGGRGE
jgi:hypothetical protein